MKTSVDLGRRRIVIRGVCIAGLAVATTVAGVGASAAKATKSAMMYQDRPHDGKRCADCKFFSPPSAGGDAGKCSVVDGPVNRDGWCMAFSPNTSM